MAALGFSAGLTIVPQQHRLFAAVPSLAPVAVGLNGSGTYIATALGAAAGGTALAVGGSVAPAVTAAVIGLLDLAAEAYFLRRLPWQAGDAEAFNPRLAAARALVADGAVRLDGALARVGRGDRAHIVRSGASGQLSCTCQWWARYRGGRGPCRHVLAVRMVQHPGNNLPTELTTEEAR